MLSSRLVRAALALCLVMAAIGVSACSCSRAPQTTSQTSQLASATPDASSAVAATASADATSATGAGTQNGSAKGLSSKDAAAIDAELTAIQKELDKLALPSDQDFGGIESGLK